MQNIMEAVPNFSEGRDPLIIGKLMNCFSNVKGVKLLDCSSDGIHNRTVMTIVGNKDSLIEPLIESTKIALEYIDLNKHKGAHPRIGALDVCPFVPIRGCTMDDAITLAKEFGKRVGEIGIPVFLYEKAAINKDREDLSYIRRGEFENMDEKMKDPLWASDFGPKNEIHKTFGVMAIGARMPLVAFNVLLNTKDIEVAKQIADRVSYRNGGLRFIRTMASVTKGRGLTQISMNLTDYTKTHLYQALEMVKFEARRYGVSVLESELMGIVPMDALIDTTSYYLGISNFRKDQILETRILD